MGISLRCGWSRPAMALFPANFLVKIRLPVQLALTWIKVMWPLHEELTKDLVPRNGDTGAASVYECWGTPLYDARELARSGFRLYEGSRLLPPAGAPRASSIRRRSSSRRAADDGIVGITARRHRRAPHLQSARSRCAIRRSFSVVTAAADTGTPHRPSSFARPTGRRKGSRRRP